MSAPRRIAAMRGLVALALGALAVSPASAQLPSPSAAALGLGDNYTAAARGYGAAAWNPAGLGMPDNPRSSFALLSVRGVTGLDPVTAGDLAAYQGEMLPDAVRTEWLQRIEDEGSQQGMAGAEVSYLAASAGRFAFHLSTSAAMRADLGPEAAELLLYGNAGRTGEPADVRLSAASLDVAVTSTVAAAYGQPVWRRPGASLSLGATVKYTLGHVLVVGRDQGSELTADPLALGLRFPVVQTDTAFSPDELGNGAGVGVDLGAAWAQGALTVAGVVRNVFSSFEWDRSRLYHRRGEAVFTADRSESDFRPLPFDEAPEALRDEVADLEFGPEVAIGATYRPRPSLLVTSDVRHRTTDGGLYGPATHLGVGAELTPVRWFAARVGAAGLSGGYLLSAGLGLRLGVVDLSASVAHRETDLGTGAIAMFTFSSISR